MASRYGIKTKESRSFKDVALSFSRNPQTADINILTNESAIKQAIKNVVLTRPGEKLFEPLFGSEVSGLLFENFDFILADQLRTEVITAIETFEPRVVLDDVTVEWLEEDHAVEIGVTYTIVGESVLRELSFLLEPR